MPDSPQPAVVETLRQAVAGLLFPSETDAPFEPFFWPGDAAAPPDPADVARLSGASDAPVKKVKLETFFRPATKAETWHNDEEKALVARFEELVRTLKTTLKDPVVFRVGKTQSDAYIVGMVEGGYAGLKTQVVET